MSKSSSTNTTRLRSRSQSHQASHQRPRAASRSRHVALREAGSETVIAMFNDIQGTLDRRVQRRLKVRRTTMLVLIEVL